MLIYIFQGVKYAICDAKKKPKHQEELARRQNVLLEVEEKPSAQALVLRGASQVVKQDSSFLNMNR